MSRKRIKFENAILCEHVVAGAHNKHILINVYSGDIRVAEMPATIHLGIYIVFADDAPSELQLELSEDKKKKASFDVAFPDGTADTKKTLVLPLMTPTFENDLVFRVVAVAKGYARTTIIEKKIFQADLTS